MGTPSTLHATASLAVELSNAYVALLHAEAQADEALRRGDVATYERHASESRRFGSLIERIEVEMAVVRSAVFAAA